MTQSGNNNDDDTTIHHDEWDAAIKKAAPQNGRLTARQIRFLKRCRVPSKVNNHEPLSFEKIAELWEKLMGSKTCRSTIRNRWYKIEQDEQKKKSLR